MLFRTTAMDLEWDWVMVLTILIILLEIIPSDIIHTAIIPMVTIPTATIHTVTIPTVHTMVLVVDTATTHTDTVWADWDGVDMATDGLEMEMETVGEVQATTENL